MDPELQNATDLDSGLDTGNAEALPVSDESTVTDGAFAEQDASTEEEGSDAADLTQRQRDTYRGLLARERKAREAAEAAAKQQADRLAAIEQRIAQTETQRQQEHLLQQQQTVEQQARIAKIAEIRQRVDAAKQAGFDPDGNPWTDARLQRAAEAELAQFDNAQALKREQARLEVERGQLTSERVAGGIQRLVDQRASELARHFKDTQGVTLDLPPQAVIEAAVPSIARFLQALPGPPSAEQMPGMMEVMDQIIKASALAVAFDRASGAKANGTRREVLAAATKQLGLPEGGTASTGHRATLEAFRNDEIDIEEFQRRMRTAPSSIREQYRP